MSIVSKNCLAAFAGFFIFGHFPFWWKSCSSLKFLSCSWLNDIERVLKVDFESIEVSLSDFLNPESLGLIKSRNMSTYSSRYLHAQPCIRAPSLVRIIVRPS